MFDRIVPLAIKTSCGTYEIEPGKDLDTSLALISNLIWFYMFLNREYYDVARGIIFAMLCFIPYMIYVNLF